MKLGTEIQLRIPRKYGVQGSLTYVGTSFPPWVDGAEPGARPVHTWRVTFAKSGHVWRFLFWQELSETYTLRGRLLTPRPPTFKQILEQLPDWPSGSFQEFIRRHESWEDPARLVEGYLREVAAAQWVRYLFGGDTWPDDEDEQ